MAIPEKQQAPPVDDVLHSAEHSHLSAEEIAKAVARHKREHPEKQQKQTGKAPRKGRAR